MNVIQILIIIVTVLWAVSISKREHIGDFEVACFFVLAIVSLVIIAKFLINVFPIIEILTYKVF